MQLSIHQAFNLTDRNNEPDHLLNWNAAQSRFDDSQQIFTSGTGTSNEMPIAEARRLSSFKQRLIQS